MGYLHGFVAPGTKLHYPRTISRIRYVNNIWWMQCVAETAKQFFNTGDFMYRPLAQWRRSFARFHLAACRPQAASFCERSLRPLYTLMPKGALVVATGD
jgi:hypothetical protein